MARIATALAVVNKDFIDVPPSAIDWLRYTCDGEHSSAGPQCNALTLPLPANPRSELPKTAATRRRRPAAAGPDGGGPAAPVRLVRAAAEAGDDPLRHLHAALAIEGKDL